MTGRERAQTKPGDAGGAGRRGEGGLLPEAGRGEWAGLRGVTQVGGGGERAPLPPAVPL